MVKKHSASRVIGVFAAQLDDAYQTALWRGIQTRARSRGVGVVCFLGHRIGSPIESEAAANAAFGIADSTDIDGLIIVSSVIATFLDSSRAREAFCLPARNAPGVRGLARARGYQRHR